MDKKQQKAIRFLFSPRGQYIVGQALFKAIQAMSEVEEMYREESNIDDMKFLMTELFPSFAAMEESWKRHAMDALTK